MKRSFMPKTILSKLSFWLCLASILLFVLYAIVSPGIDPKIDNTFYSFQTIAIIAIIFFVTSIPALLTGLYSIIFQKARSIMVFITTAVSLLLLLFMISERFLG